MKMYRLWYRLYHLSEKVLSSLFLVGAVCLSLVGATCVLRVMVYNSQIGNHLDQAARSVTPEEASTYLGQGLAQMSVRGLDHGTTAFFVQTPSEDIGLWFTRLTRAREELESVRAGTATERSTAVVNVRGVISCGGPDGISSHGYGVMLLLCAFLSLLIAITPFVLSDDTVQDWLRAKANSASDGTPT